MKTINAMDAAITAVATVAAWWLLTQVIQLVGIAMLSVLR